VPRLLLYYGNVHARAVTDLHFLNATECAFARFVKANPTGAGAKLTIFCHRSRMWYL